MPKAGITQPQCRSSGWVKALAEVVVSRCLRWAAQERELCSGSQPRVFQSSPWSVDPITLCRGQSNKSWWGHTAGPGNKGKGNRKTQISSSNLEAHSIHLSFSQPYLKLLPFSSRSNLSANSLAHEPLGDMKYLCSYQLLLQWSNGRLCNQNNFIFR